MGLWLVSMDMDQYASEFTARGVDGSQLLSLDGEKLKVSPTQVVSQLQFCPFYTLSDLESRAIFNALFSYLCPI